MEEPMDVDNDSENATTLTPELLKEIIETPESLAKNLGYCNERISGQKTIMKKLQALLGKTSKNTALLESEAKNYKLEHEQVSNDVEKLKVLAENLEQKLQNLEENPSNEPLVQAEEHVQDCMRLRQARKNPDQANLTSEISQFEQKIETIQRALAQVDESTRDTKLKISTFQVPKVIPQE